MFDVLLKCGYAVTVLMLDPQDETKADTESFENVIEMLLEAVKKNCSCCFAVVIAGKAEVAVDTLFMMKEK